ncbi:MAG TPA: CBS domain-containing protein [Rubrivivax sp.]|nr:CBS domain-containing protein [Rubrivivax sp.]
MAPVHVAVEEYTTPNPVTAELDMPIGDVQQLMREHGVRHLPVVRDGRVLGVISDRDVRVVLGLSTEHRHQVRAGDIMAPQPLTVNAAAPLDEVAYAMSERKVGSAIVNDENGEFLGIFTATDALNALIELTRRLRR